MEFSKPTDFKRPEGGTPRRPSATRSVLYLEERENGKMAVTYGRGKGKIMGVVSVPPDEARFIINAIRSEYGKLVDLEEAPVQFVAAAKEWASKRHLKG